MHCTHCGAAVPDGAVSCPACGKGIGLTVAEVATREVPAAPSSGPAQAPMGVARYGGFWRRVAASVIDGLVLMGLSIVLIIVAMVVLMAGGAPDEQAVNRYALVYYLASYAVGWLYFAIMQSGPWQASLGKRALGIKVVDLQGGRISFGRATGRYFAYLVTSTLTLGIGLLMAAFTKRRQALHDFVAGTLVVSRETAPEDLARGLERPKVSGAVVALAVVAGLVPVTGILAAIAIPAYQDYVIRTQVAEGLAVAGPFKDSVAAAYAEGTAFEDMDTAGLGLEAANGPHVESVSVEAGVVVITYGGAASPHLSGRTLLLVPGASSQGDVLWTCGLAEPPVGTVEIAIEDHEQYTDVEPRYLPQSCRG